MDKSIYFNYNKAMSYNAMLTIIIGERGVGKTYGAKDYCVKHYNKKKKRFAWLRRYSTDLDSAIGTSDHADFFKDISEKYPGKYRISETKKIKNIIYNDNLIGYGMSLRSAESLKGTAYNDVDTIILDEFLVGDGGSRYIKNEPMYLLSIIETIARFRPIRVILLGNATSVYNPYFDFFNIHLPYNSEYQLFKNNTILVCYIKNQKYREAKKNSTFGKLIEGTEYESYAVDNKFINDNNNFIAKKPEKAKLFFNIIINNTIYGVWLHEMGMFISKKYNPNYNINVTFDTNSHNNKTLYIKSRNVFIENMMKHFERGLLFFENQNVKHSVMDLMKKARLI